MQLVDKKSPYGYGKFLGLFMKVHTCEAHVLVILSALILSNCASFEPRLGYDAFLRNRPPTTDQVQEGVAVSVEEFVSAVKSRQVFDTNIAQYGVLALLVRVQNNGPESCKIIPQTISASLDRQPLVKLSAEDAAAHSATKEYLGKAVGLTLISGPLAVLLCPATIGGSAIHTHNVNQRIIDQFRSVEFREALLQPNQTAVGFVYFARPKNILTLENMTMVVQTIDDSGGTRLRFELSLPTLTISAPNP